MCAFQVFFNVCICASFVLQLSCWPVVYFCLKAHSNLDALRAANTNPPNFVLHEVTDSCERLFERFGIGSNASGYPFEKNCHPFERLWLSVWKRNVIEWLRLSVWENLLSVRTARTISLKRNAIHPFEGLRTTQANPFEENCHSIERLGYPLEKKCNPSLRRSSNDTG